MKKSLVVLLSSALVLSSCGTYTGSGAFAGGSIGTILGSAIGGIAGGSRGSDIGTIIGMAGGAVVGATMGSQADQREQQVVHDHYDRVQQNKARGINPYEKHQQAPRLDSNSHDDAYIGNQSGVEEKEPVVDSTNSGDDRIYDFQGSDYTGDYSAAKPTVKGGQQSKVENIGETVSKIPNIQIVNARFVDDNEDGTLSRGEVGKVIFEVMNRGGQTVYDIVPSVIETNHNKHIYISPSVHVESIAPGRGIRYTAVIKADKRLKDGNAKFELAVLQGRKSISHVTEFNIPTRK